MSDDQAWDEEIPLAGLADELGFGVLHFKHSFCPDSLQLWRHSAPTSTSAPQR